MNDSDV